MTTIDRRSFLAGATVVGASAAIAPAVRLLPATPARANELHDPDLGLSHDLPTLLNRRRALGLLTGAGLAAALAA